MGMKLSEVKARVRTTIVVWEDEKVDVGYRPAAITPEVLEQVNDAAQSGDLSVMGTMLEPVLDWWDVLDDEGERIPPTASFIRTMPIAFLMAVLEQVQEAMRPPEKRD